MFHAYPKRGALLASVVAVLALFATLFVAAPANAAGTGTVSGDVFLGQGFAVSAKAGEVVVTLAKVNGATLEPVVGVSATTNAGGGFTIGGLEEGQYAITFTYTGTGPYMVPWTPRERAQTGIFYWGSIPKLNLLGGRVSVDAANNYARAGEVRVTATSSESTFSTVTDADGRYNFGRVLPDNVGYQISFEYLGAGNYYPVWYYNQDAVGTPTSSGLQGWYGPDSPNVNVVIGGLGSRISGTLSASNGGPASAVTVNLYTDSYFNSTQYTFVRSTVTDSNGYYSFRGLPYWVNGLTVLWGQDPDDGIAAGAAPNGNVFTDGAKYDARSIPVISDVNGTVFQEALITTTLSATVEFTADLSDTGWGEVGVLVEWWNPSTSAWEGPYLFDTLYTSHPTTSVNELPPGRFRVTMQYSGEVPVSNPTGPSYELTLTEGQHVTLPFKLTTAGGTFVPQALVAPSVSGATTVGSVWTANPGTWTTGTSTSVFWLRCSQPQASTFTTVPSGCIAIPGATSTTYTATAADAGKYLTVQVAGSSQGIFTLAGAISTTPIQSALPVMTVAPSVSGAAPVGSTWTAQTGTWTAPTTPTFAIYWLRCSQAISATFTSVPAGCAAIPGATGSTYVSTAADVGKYLSVQVAANGGGGFTLAGALTAAATTAIIPVNTVAPSVSGAATAGSTWTANTGTWTGSPTFAIYWLRCSTPITSGFTTVPAGCSAITGATGPTYTSTGADAGKYLTVQVAGNGSGGFALAGALNSTAIQSTVPVNTVAPTVSGSSTVGSTWTANTGTWTGSPTFAIYWLRCSAPITSGFTTVPAGCSAIVGATGATYTSTAADGGKYLTVQVAGNGSGGFALAGALNSTVVQSTTPTNTVAPSVSGASSVGSTWTANTGTWTGSPTFAIYWLRCSVPITSGFTTVPAGCSAIPGATGATYTSTPADGGKYLTVQVAGNGASGFALAGALNSTAIVSTVPTNTVAPSVSGASAVGSTWTANTGTWTGSPTFAIYWLRCSAPITSGFTTVPAGCSAIPGATGPSYTATTADGGKYLTVQVAGNGASGFALAGALNSTAIVSTAPTNTVPPTVAGVGAIGSTWTATTGTWTGSPTIAVYWLRCSSPVTSTFTTVPSGCAVIPGATSTSYATTAADSGKYLTVQVAGNGSTGFALSGAISTAPMDSLTAAPTNTAAPTVSGASAVGSVWTATTGTWTGSPTIATYWLRCSAPITSGFTTVPAGCSAIPGATGTTYTSTAADIGKYLTVQVAGNGSAGFALAGALNSTATG